jgi:hypothetical protein
MGDGFVKEKLRFPEVQSSCKTVNDRLSFEPRSFWHQNPGSFFCCFVLFLCPVIENNAGCMAVPLQCGRVWALHICSGLSYVWKDHWPQREGAVPAESPATTGGHSSVSALCPRTNAFLFLWPCFPVNISLLHFWPHSQQACSKHWKMAALKNVGNSWPDYFPFFFPK